VLLLPGLVSSGASQAIIGLAGVAIVDLRRHRSWARSRPDVVALVVAAVAIQVALDAGAAGLPLKPGHLFGLAAGVALGWALTGRPQGQRPGSSGSSISSSISSGARSIGVERPVGRKPTRR
jgi:hypothetical protein